LLLYKQVGGVGALNELNSGNTELTWLCVWEDCEWVARWWRVGLHWPVWTVRMLSVVDSETRRDLHTEPWQAGRLRWQSWVVQQWQSQSNVQMWLCDRT